MQTRLKLFYVLVAIFSALSSKTIFAQKPSRDEQIREVSDFFDHYQMDLSALIKEKPSLKGRKIPNAAMALFLWDQVNDKNVEELVDTFAKDIMLDPHFKLPKGYASSSIKIYDSDLTKKVVESLRRAPNYARITDFQQGYKIIHRYVELGQAYATELLFFVEENGAHELIHFETILGKDAPHSLLANTKEIFYHKWLTTPGIKAKQASFASKMEVFKKDLVSLILDGTEPSLSKNKFGPVTRAFRNFHIEKRFGVLEELIGYVGVKHPSRLSGKWIPLFEELQLARQHIPEWMALKNLRIGKTIPIIAFVVGLGIYDSLSSSKATSQETQALLAELSYRCGNLNNGCAGALLHSKNISSQTLWKLYQSALRMRADQN